MSGPDPGATLERSRRELAGLLARGLAGHGRTVTLDVAALGVRDSFERSSRPGDFHGRDAFELDFLGRDSFERDSLVGEERPAGGRSEGNGPTPARASAPGPAQGSAPGPDPDSDPYSDPGQDSVTGPEVPVRFYGRHAVVGPFPPVTAHSGVGAEDGPVASLPGPCPRCLSRRWQAVRSVALREALELGSGTRAAGESPYLTPFTAEALAGLIAARLEGAGPAPTGGFPAVHLVDLQTLGIRHYPLVPDPECPRCGRTATGQESATSAASPEPQPPESPGSAGSAGSADPDEPDGVSLVPAVTAVPALTLRPAPKHRPDAFRVRDLSAYDLPVEPYANPVCGALGPSVVHDVSSTSTSATIGCFSMRSGDYLRETFWGGHADRFGDSVRIGVLEGLERYAGMRARSRTATVRDSLTALRSRGVPAVDPAECGLYAPEFHAANPHVPPFTPDRVVPWVWGHSLRDRRPILVPEVLTYYHAPGLENRFVQESSNGCASGGCLEEATYFGLMEVVERDAFLLAWYGRLALPEIDPLSSDRPATRHMVERLAMYGYEARFFDTRITFPIPVVTGVAVRYDGGPGRMCFGAGAGLDPEAALAAALCEIGTDAVNLPGRTERDEERLRAMVADFDRVAALHDHPLVYGVPEMGVHAEFLIGRPGEPRPPRHTLAERFRDGSALPVSPDLRDDLLRCVDAVTAAGFDVVVVDQTAPAQRALGLTTVSVLVPGLLPIDFGWTRQRALRMPRLRTAPRQAGLRDRDLTDDDLNPAPHPFP